MDISAKILKKIKNYEAKKVFIQVPEGLKTQILELANELENSGIVVFVGCDPVYGACDLADKQAKSLGCDLLVHIGHTDFGVKPCLPVIYEPYYIEYDPLPILEKNLDYLKPYNNIALLTTIQFKSILNPAKEFLENSGKKVIFSKNLRNNEPGILLGCDQSAALPMEKDVDCFLYIGSGKFHPLGLALKTEKPVLSLNMETQELVDYEKEVNKLRKIKAFHIEQAKESNNFGILVSTKPGQSFPDKAISVKNQLKEKGKNAWLLVMSEITESKLLGLKIQVLVNCTCPRIQEDFSLLKKPILNPEDINQI